MEFPACLITVDACGHNAVGCSSLSAADAQTVDDLLGNIDLSEAAFARMTVKIKEMQAVKVREREWK